MLHDVIASVARGWTRDEIVDKYFNMSSEVMGVYLPEHQQMDVENK
jgi:hypothetical protein